MGSIVAVKNESFLELLRLGGSMILGEKLSKKEFETLALSQELVQMERESDGTVIIMPLVHGGSGKRENLLGTYIRMWQMQSGMGEVYGSTTGFDLPDGSTRAPDAAWISDERLAELSAEEEENSFIPVVPDFVVEIRSSSDRLPKVRGKMLDVWMANGVRLAWLIDPYEERVNIFRENGTEDVVEGFKGKKLSGEDVMPGLEVPLDKLRIQNSKLKTSAAA